MPERNKLLIVLGILLLLPSLYGLLGVLQAASLFIGLRALSNANIWGSVFLTFSALSGACFFAAFRTSQKAPSLASATIGLLLIAFALWFGFPIIHDLLALDSCIDRGGSFDHLLSVCDFTQSHPAISTLQRQGFRLTAFLIFSPIGLLLVVAYWRSVLLQSKKAV